MSTLILIMISVLISMYIIYMIQIILLEMFMDLGASSTFVLVPPESDISTNSPRNPRKSILTRSFLLQVITGGISLFLGVITSYLVGLSHTGGNVDIAHSMAFSSWMIGHFVV